VDEYRSGAVSQSSVRLFVHNLSLSRVRAVFYDIDGTIKPAAEPHIPQANADAIEQMQRLGIRVCFDWMDCTC
jgi:hypothetical protein